MTPCIACQGTGVGEGQGEAPQGQLLPLCRSCRGTGIAPSLKAGEGWPAPPGTIDSRSGAWIPSYIAIWLVGKRYVVRMTVPRRRGVVELDLEWTPRLPPVKGPGKLKPAELAQYKAGRDQALRMLNADVGGSFDIVEAGERH